MPRFHRSVALSHSIEGGGHWRCWLGHVYSNSAVCYYSVMVVFRAKEGKDRGKVSRGIKYTLGEYYCGSW